MNIGDTIPYGIKIAASQGVLTKGVKKIQIAAVQGAINKLVTGVKMAPVQGAISKRIFIGGGILGDVSGEGNVSVTDYTLVRLHLDEISVLTQEEQNRADVDRDGSVTESDYELLRDYILDL